jgi:hypothetical protein
MDFKVAGLNPASFAETLDFQKSSAEVAPISLQDIRSLRQGFEREAETLRPVLGAAEHQSMLIAMYEGTEQLLNRRVPAFAVHEYLEGLKGSAQELRNQGTGQSRISATALQAITTFSALRSQSGIVLTKPCVPTTASYSVIRLSLHLIDRSDASLFLYPSFLFHQRGLGEV